MLKVIDTLYKTYSTELSLRAQLAGLCFVIGKLLSIPCFILLFINKTAVLVSIILYSAAILASFVLCVLDMANETKKMKRQQQNA